MKTYGRINLTNPVVTDHPLNKGRLAWWYMPPDSGWSPSVTDQFTNTGPILRDLCNRFNGIVTAGSANVPRPDTIRSMRVMRWYGGGTTDGSVNLGGTSAFAFTNNFTVGCTFTTDTLVPAGTGNTAGLLGKYQSPASNAWTFRQANATIEFGGSTLTTSGSILVVGTEYRAIAVMNAGTATIYLNGRSVASGAVAITSTADTVRMGENYFPTGAQFRGRIGDAFISNRPWSLAEVLADFKYSQCNYLCPGSPLRFVDVPVITVNPSVLTFSTVGTGHDRLSISGPISLTTIATADVEASGIGSIEDTGTLNLESISTGSDILAISPPTLIYFSTIGTGADTLELSNPMNFSTIGRGRNRITSYGPNGDRRILAQRRYRR